METKKEDKVITPKRKEGYRECSVYSIPGIGYKHYENISTYMAVNSIKYKNIEGICFVGDVHGEWKTLGYKAVEQYGLENYLIIQLGDFGIGFNSEEYNKIELKKLNSKLKKKNNQLVALRGNHDDKSYFTPEYSKSYSNINLVPDYTILEIEYERDVPDDGIQTTSGYMNILCIGGGLSIDRTERWKWKISKPGRNYYWDDEMPVYDELKLNEINKDYPNDIHVVATHTSPSFTFPFTKTGIHHWMMRDMQLRHDSEVERGAMDKIFHKLKENQENLSEWYYAHFHATQSITIEDVSFRLLDIYEFRSIVLK